MTDKDLIEKLHVGSFNQRQIVYNTRSHIPGIKICSKVASIDEITQIQPDNKQKPSFFWWVELLGIQNEGDRGNCDTLEAAEEVVEAKLEELGYKIVTLEEIIG